MYLFLSLSLILLTSVSGSPQDVPAESFFDPEVSIVHLVANPEKYDGKRVKVFGYLHVRFEDSALYLTKDDADHLIGANAVWVSYDPAAKLGRLDGKEIETRDVGDLRCFDGRYVMLDGIFSMKERGHMGSFSGGVKDVVRVLELRRWFDGKKNLVKFDKRGRIIPQRKRR